MNVISYPLRYLSLKDEKERSLYRRNGMAVVSITLILTLPFLVPGANYFGDSGFLDRFGNVAAILSGFYVAALVGVASFTSSLGDLDKIIEVGKVSGLDASGESYFLTRRQYVCTLFGYLAFVCLSLSTISVLFVVVTQVVKGEVISAIPTDWSTSHWFSDTLLPLTRIFIIALLNMTISHMIVTTFHGLYYLIDRLYDKQAVAKPKRPE